MATYVGIGTTDPDDDMIFGDNNVGIGTTSPAALLSVKGGDADIGEGTGQFLNNLSDQEWKNYNFLLVGKDSSSGQSAIFGYRYSSTGGNEGAFVSVWGDDIHSLVVRKGGNVGIGSSLPSCALDVAGTVQTSTAVKTPAIRPVSDGAQALQIQKTDGTNVLNVDTTNSRVGIGTTSPSKPLEISKASGSGSQIDLLDLNSCDTGVGAGSKIRFRTSGNSNTLARLGVIDEGSCGGGFQFEVNKQGVQSDTTTEVVRINKNGYVGIGTTSPSEKLDVYGKIKVTEGNHTLTLEENDIKFNRNWPSYIRNDAGEDSLIAFIVNSQDVCRITPTKVWVEKDLQVDSNIASDSLDVNGNVKTSGNIEIDGDLNHDGSNVGFFNATPVSQRTKASHNNWASLSDVVNALVELGLFDQA